MCTVQKVLSMEFLIKDCKFNCLINLISPPTLTSTSSLCNINVTVFNELSLNVGAGCKFLAAESSNIKKIPKGDRVAL